MRMGRRGCSWLGANRSHYVFRACPNRCIRTCYLSLVDTYQKRMPMRAKGDINFGFGVYHSAVFRARLRRRRKMIRALMLLSLMGLALWALWPIFQGQGTLIVTNLPPDGVLLLDEHTLTGVVTHP